MKKFLLLLLSVVLLGVQNVYAEGAENSLYTEDSEVIIKPDLQRKWAAKKAAVRAKMEAKRAEFGVENPETLSSLGIAEGQPATDENIVVKEVKAPVESAQNIQGQTADVATATAESAKEAQKQTADVATAAEEVVNATTEAAKDVQERADEVEKATAEAAEVAQKQADEIIKATEETTKQELTETDENLDDELAEIVAQTSENAQQNKDETEKAVTETEVQVENAVITENNAQAQKETEKAADNAASVLDELDDMF